MIQTIGRLIHATYKGPSSDPIYCTVKASNMNMRLYKLHKQIVNAQILVFSRSEKMRKMRALAGTEL